MSEGSLVVYLIFITLVLWIVLQIDHYFIIRKLDKILEKLEEEAKEVPK